MALVTRQLSVPDRDLNGLNLGTFTLRTIQWEDGTNRPVGFLNTSIAVSPDIGTPLAPRQVMARDVPWRQNQPYTILSTP